MRVLPCVRWSQLAWEQGPEKARAWAWGYGEEWGPLGHGWGSWGSERCRSSRSRSGSKAELGSARAAGPWSPRREHHEVPRSLRGDPPAQTQSFLCPWLLKAQSHRSQLQRPCLPVSICFRPKPQDPIPNKQYIPRSPSPSNCPELALHGLSLSSYSLPPGWSNPGFRPTSFSAFRSPILFFKFLCLQRSPFPSHCPGQSTNHMRLVSTSNVVWSEMYVSVKY